MIRDSVKPSTVLAAAADGAARMFFQNGGDPDRIFGTAGLRLSDLDDPIAELSLSRYCSLFEIAAAQTENPNIGLRFGHAFQPQQLGMLGYAALSSPTLKAALREMEMLFPAHQGLSRFCLIADDGILWLSYRILDPRIPDRRQDAELSLAIFCNIMKAALGQGWTPLEVRFEHLAPDHPAEHEKLFGCPVRFGRRTNAIAFRRKELETPMPDPDAYLLSVVRGCLKSRINNTHESLDFVEMVRNEIKLNLGSTLPSMKDMASVLGMSRADLHRKLKRYNVSFTDIIRAAREELALHYLEDPDVPLTEIALNLGYSELSAFSRAFHNWTGSSPHRYRMARLQSADTARLARSARKSAPC